MEPSQEIISPEAPVVESAKEEEAPQKQEEIIEIKEDLHPMQPQEPVLPPAFFWT